MADKTESSPPGAIIFGTAVEDSSFLPALRMKKAIEIMPQSARILTSIPFLDFISFMDKEPGAMYINLIRSNRKSLSKEAFSSVVRPGFEPRQTVPKTVVLPLHHRTNLAC